MNLRRAAIVTMALLLLPILTSCVSVLSPTGWAPVVFDGNTAYLTTSKGRLSAIDLNGDTGIARWTFPDKDRDEDDDFKTRAIYGAPVVNEDRLYLATFQGGVFALNKADGRPIWPSQDGNKNKYEGDIAGGVAVDDQNVYFGTTEGELHAWKKTDGTPADGWAEPLKFDGGIWATPIVRGDTLFVATMKGEVHAISTTDQSERWSQPFTATGAIADLSLIDDDSLFVPSINRHAYIVNIGSGSLESEFKAKDWLWTAPAVQGSKLFFGDFRGHVYGVDITSSEAAVLWDPPTVEGGERIRAGAALIDSVLIIADRKPVISFFDATKGTLLNQVAITDSGTVRANLVVHEGAAYFGTTDGDLYRAEVDGRKVVPIQLSGVKR